MFSKCKKIIFSHFGVAYRYDESSFNFVVCWMIFFPSSNCFEIKNFLHEIDRKIKLAISLNKQAGKMPCNCVPSMSLHVIYALHCFLAFRDIIHARLLNFLAGNSLDRKNPLLALFCYCFIFPATISRLCIFLPTALHAHATKCWLSELNFRPVPASSQKR